MSEVGKFLLILGVLMVLMGALLMVFEKPPFGLGRLPGDIVFRRDNLTIYVPLMTSILLSLALTFLLNLFLSLKR
ncbi:MAG TPA: DUF2905 domain-containing protein [Aquifex aeolicus]|nr:DUF2905 domain-containing protein [Aquifex aeolicus]